MNIFTDKEVARLRELQTSREAISILEKAKRVEVAQAAPAQKVEKCIDCGDEVPKGACYCKEGCAHAIGYAAQQAAPAAQKVEAQQWAVFCAGCDKKWAVPYIHPGKSICANCEAKLKATPAQNVETTDLVKRLRETASKGVSVWGDLQMEAAKEIEILTAEREAYASAMDRMKAQQAAPAQEPKQPDIFCGVDFADGLLTVSVLRRCEDGVAELLHCEQLELPQAAPAAQRLSDVRLVVLAANAGVSPMLVATDNGTFIRLGRAIEKAFAEKNGITLEQP